MIFHILISKHNSYCSNQKEVLKRLQEHGVYLKQEKCFFFKDSVEYLGHCISVDEEPRNSQEVNLFRALKILFKVHTEPDFITVPVT